MSCSKRYLFTYNVLQALGWSYILCKGITLLQNPTDLWVEVRTALLIFQTAAILEIVHSVAGIVSSSPLLTSFQVSSRLFTIWGVLEVSPLATASIGLPILTVAWCVTEITRYTYYASTLTVPVGCIAWCRYSFFILLYPIGAIGELLCWYQSLQDIKETQILSVKLLNSYNFAFDYHSLLIIVVIIFIIVFPIMYHHMLNQRNKVLKLKQKLN